MADNKQISTISPEPTSGFETDIPKTEPGTIDITPTPIEATEKAEADDQINANIDDNMLESKASVEPSMEMWDFIENRPRNVPESLVQKAILSGQFSFRKGIKIPVQSPNGDFGTIDSENAEKLFKQKYTFETRANRSTRREADEREADLEEKFGDKELTAAATAAASGLTLGISDQALVKSGLFEEGELREIRERSPIISGVAEAVGFTAPLLFTGGTSGAAALTAKGLTKAGAIVKGAAKTGQLAEKAVASILKKVLKDTGTKSLAKKIIASAAPKVAGSAVEASFFGAGHVLSENALGRADLNAENVAAAVGMSAILGGAIGGTFGVASATIPTVTKGVKTVTSGVRGKIADKFKNATSKEEAFFDLVGMSANARVKMKQFKSKMVEDIPEWFIEKAKVKGFSSSKSHFENIIKLKNSAGKQIESIMNKVDDVLGKTPELIEDRSVTSQSVMEMLEDNYLVKFAEDPHVMSELAPVRKIFNNWRKVGNRSKPMTANELWSLRKSADDRIDYINIKQDLKSQALRDVRDVLSNKINELAERASLGADDVSVNLSDQLKSANKDFHFSASILDNLRKKVDKDLNKNMVSFTDMILGAISLGTGDPTALVLGVGKKFLESDLKNRMVLLNNIEKSANKVTNTVNAGIDNFLGISTKGFGKLRKTVGPLSTKALLSTSFSDNDKKRKKPQNKLEAFDLISQEITDRASNAEKTMFRIQNKTTRLRHAAPEIAQQLEQAAIRSINFLFERMPKAEEPTGSLQMGKRKFEPSTLEISKFERYLSAVQDPMSVVQDLAEGNLSPEGVETLRTVYPEIYSQLQNTIMDKVGELDNELPYDKRLQLGMLFDLPTDPSLKPNNIVGLQGQFLSEGEKENIEVQNRASDNGVINTTTKGLSQLDKASRATTPLGKIQAK